MKGISLDLSIKISTSSFNRIIIHSLSLFLYTCLLFFPGSDPARAEEKKDLDDDPIRITSDRMVGEKGASMVEFIGNVEATQLDSVLLADSMKVYFVTDKKKKNQAQSNITKIVSTGNVRYTAGERKAFADEAVYTTADDVLVLKGTAPRLVTGTSFVTGKKITLYRKDDRVLVESDGKKRVEALLNPEDKPDKKE